MLKKANAIVEYGIVIAIVALFLAAIASYLRRNIQARIKRESDITLGHAIGLEWPEQTYTIGGRRSVSERADSVGGEIRRASVDSDWQISYQQPLGKAGEIMKHKKAAMHTQDAATGAPGVSYPGLQYNDWQDKGWDI